MDDRPIGVFDSGLGGLTVLKELMANLPGESFVYFGDCGRIPYGSKSEETVRMFTLQNISFLMEKNVKAVVIACNTASSFGYRSAVERFDVPVFEVVSPGARAAIQRTKSGRIGVIGTQGTISSDVYERTIRSELARSSCSAAPSEVKVYSRACPLFVPLAEEGWWANDIARRICEEYLHDMKSAGVDALVLGCTHYPLLAQTIGEYMGEDVALITSGEVLSAEMKDFLDKNDMNSSDTEGNGTCEFYTSDSVDKFRELGEQFLGSDIANISKMTTDQFLCE